MTQERESGFYRIKHKETGLCGVVHYSHLDKCFRMFGNTAPLSSPMILDEYYIDTEPINPEFTIPKAVGHYMAKHKDHIDNIMLWYFDGKDYYPIKGGPRVEVLTDWIVSDTLIDLDKHFPTDR